MSGQGIFTDRLDTLERNAMSHDDKISTVLSRIDSLCPDSVSSVNRRAFPANRGSRGRGRPYIAMPSDRRSFESKSRDFNVPRKRGSEFRPSVRDAPSRHY